MKKLTKYEINAIAKKVWDQISKKIASRLNTLGGEKLQQLKEQCSNDSLESGILSSIILSTLPVIAIKSILPASSDCLDFSGV